MFRSKLFSSIFFIVSLIFFSIPSLRPSIFPSSIPSLRPFSIPSLRPSFLPFFIPFISPFSRIYAIAPGIEVLASSVRGTLGLSTFIIISFLVEVKILQN